jgi:hypothetical protein
MFGASCTAPTACTGAGDYDYASGTGVALTEVYSG